MVRTHYLVAISVTVFGCNVSCLKGQDAAACQTGPGLSVKFVEEGLPGRNGG